MKLIRYHPEYRRTATDHCRPYRSRLNFTIYYAALYAFLQLQCLFAGSSVFASESSGANKNTEVAPVFSVPLTSGNNWEVLRYSRIPANQVDFSKDGLKITVDKSAGPLVYPLKPRLVQEVSFEIEIYGNINLNGQAQGSKGVDDFLFRLGLVYEGEHTLNFLQRRFAADWILRLFELASEETGVGRIQFYNVYSDSTLANTQRMHPQSKLIGESFIFPAPTNGKLSARIKTNSDAKVLALWISVDGDDTKSTFTVHLKEVLLRWF